MSSGKVIAEVCGRVTYVNKQNSKYFGLYTEKMGKKFRCICDFFCPVREGDALFGICEYEKTARYGDQLTFLKEPFVIPAEDKETLSKNLITALRGSGYGPSQNDVLLDLLTVKCGSSTEIIKLLDKMSSDHCYKKEVVSYPLNSCLKEKQISKLLMWWYKNRLMRRLYLLGLNNRQIRDANMDPIEVYATCLENPYKIFSLDMNKCEDILNRLGKEIQPDVRKAAEITRTIMDHMDNGWVGSPSRFIVQKYPDIKKYLPLLHDEYGVVPELFTFYLPYSHEVETSVADLVHEYTTMDILPNAIGPGEINYSRDLSEDQKLAVEGALYENISVITGIAGSGKTSTISQIVHNLEEKKIKYRVVSFTGKAVAKLREVIQKKDPMTMNMMITLPGKQDFEHLIIDEASMVTTALFYEFVKKFNHKYRITMVGDPNQLMPIGWGTLFQELIDSGTIPTYRLIHCHRLQTDGQNNILRNANRIVQHADPMYGGPEFDFDISGNFDIILGGPNEIENLVKAIRDAGISPDEVMIISPYNKYLTEINRRCQMLYNGDKRCITDSHSIEWRIDDRVMMIENNYKINIMNGDEGKVTDLTESEIEVTFKDGTSHVFDLDRHKSSDKEYSTGKDVLTVKSLVHSFAVSVHRSQGSEWNYVILYVPETSANKFLNRNLTYTAITRSKKMLWCVGDYTTMVRAATTPPPYRCDNLAKRVKQLL